MNLKKQIKTIIKKFKKDDTLRKYDAYLHLYKRNSFSDTKCQNYEQYEAVITRWYHTIEKGLSYKEYRPGFGKENIEKMLILMESYEKKYSTDSFFYRTALSCLHEYINKNKENGLIDFELTERVNRLSGEPNNSGGVINFKKPICEKVKTYNYEELMKNRHSIREFSDEAVELDIIRKAIELSQYTPSACNRQGWRTHIIADKTKIAHVLQYQTGSRGFREKIDKLLLVTCDIRYFNKKREIFQPFIDGGMYAESLINALFYQGVGSVPLSASLTYDNEKHIREITGINSSEVLILFIGVGNYPDHCLTPRSERKKDIKINII